MSVPLTLLGLIERGPRHGSFEQGAGPERRRYVTTEAGMADVQRWLAALTEARP